MRPLLEPLESRTLLSAIPKVTIAPLLTDGGPAAPRTDAHIANAWGLSVGPSGTLWIADNGSGSSTIVNRSGAQVVSTINIPAPTGGTESSPTGVVTTPVKGFNITANGHTAPARYLWVTEQGVIAGWHESVDPANAITAIDHSSTGAVYKGAAIGKDGKRSILYVANFHDGTIETYDSTFATAIFKTQNPFHDPNLPAGFAPFNIQNLGGKLYVTYAKQDEARTDDVAGTGNGVIDLFNVQGKLLKRIATGGTLNSPWGLAIAPSSFQKFSGKLLVANFGDGAIQVFDQSKGKPLGSLTNSTGQPIVIDGAWALQTGDGTKAGAQTVFFTAGPNEESHGLFGTLTAAKPPKSTSGGFHY